MAQARSGKRKTIEDCTLSLSISDDGSERVIEPFGELDAACVGAFEEQLRDAIEGSERVVIDLSGLDFIDSVGIEAIYRAVDPSAANGVELGVIRGSGAVERTFEVMGLDRSLPFLD